MKVALDARFLAGERKGIGRYLHTLLTGFAASAARPDFVLFTDGELDADYSSLRCETVRLRAPAVYAWEQLTLPRALRRLRPDVFHAPGNALPLRPPPNAILTLHDCMMFERRFHTAAANRYYFYQAQVLRRAVPRCRAVITVSRASAADIARRFGEQVAARTVVIAEAVDPVFSRSWSADERERFRRRLALPARYFLHLGAAFPRKNTRLVLAAYGRAAAQAEVPPLVIGGVAENDLAAVSGWVAASGLGDRVRVVGYLPPQDHALLVSCAELLVYPSAYEGFGLPALEAMAAGVPVLTSPRGALPDTCRGAAFYAEPEEEAVAAALTTLAADAGRRGEMAAAGKARAASFSAPGMAARTYDVYRAAAEGSPRGRVI